MANPRWLDETEQRAWRGLVALHLVAFPEIERRLRRYGLVHVEYGVLVALSENPPSMRLCDLAEGLNMSQSRLTHRMRKLLDQRLVRQEPSEDDRRVALASITPDGMRLLRRIAPRHVQDVREVIFDQLDSDQVAALADALSSIVAGLGIEPLPLRGSRG
jgi:DNA-binding MarR family transcriptional regulator